MLLSKRSGGGGKFDPYARGGGMLQKISPRVVSLFEMLIYEYVTLALQIDLICRNKSLRVRC